MRWNQVPNLPPASKYPPRHTCCCARNSSSFATIRTEVLRKQCTWTQQTVTGLDIPAGQWHSDRGAWSLETVILRNWKDHTFFQTRRCGYNRRFFNFFRMKLLYLLQFSEYRINSNDCFECLNSYKPKLWLILTDLFLIFVNIFCCFRFFPLLLKIP